MAFDLKWTTALAAALLAGGCNRASADDGWTADTDTAICTDAQGKRLPDDRCRQHRVGGGGGMAHWYFLRRGGIIPFVGERARGGSFRATGGIRYQTAPVSTAMTRSAAISRGGFGSSAHHFGGARS